MQNKDKLYQIIAIAFSAILVVLIAIKLYNYFQSPENNPRELKTLISENENDIIWGQDDAPLRMVMFSSYKCKFCTLFFNEVFPKIKEQYIAPGDLKMVLKFIDLREEPDMMRAIQAAVCINKFSNFEKFHELLLLNSNIVHTRDFQFLLDDFLAENTDIAQCMVNHNSYEYIRNNNKEFRQLEFSGTPTFVINKQIFTGYRDFEHFNNILKRALRNNTKTVN
jgi:protein-disulfide isomerase